jgi:hypothetical protein
MRASSALREVAGAFDMLVPPGKRVSWLARFAHATA